MALKRYMVIETFDPANLEAIYRRLSEKGRGLPEGLFFVDSWLAANNSEVYQLMETEDQNLLHVWADYWSDLVSFKFIELREKPTSPQ